MAESAKEKKDVIEIPVGRYIKAIRSNPWIISSVVLAVIVIVLVIALFSEEKSVTGNVISENTAGESLISFINSQGQGSATLVSAVQEGSLYKVVVDYQGQEIPVFVSLDGKYLITDPIPLSADAGALTGSDSGATAQREPVEVDIGNSPIKGSKDAPVTIVEFSDYECPFCGRFYTQSFKQIDEKYIKTGKVKLVFKDFPLSFHPNAQKAAEAARCVRDQKSDAGYFKKHEKAVQDELAYGQQLGVSGTPAFFINGLLIEGAQPYTVFEQAIENILQSS